jgi:hypothetical protein
LIDIDEEIAAVRGSKLYSFANFGLIAARYLVDQVHLGRIGGRGLGRQSRRKRHRPQHEDCKPMGRSFHPFALTAQVREAL